MGNTMFNRAPRAALLEYDEKPASPHAREASAREEVVTLRALAHHERNWRRPISLRNSRVRGKFRTAAAARRPQRRALAKAGR
jgi:hypothetical protein